MPTTVVSTLGTEDQHPWTTTEVMYVAYSNIRTPILDEVRLASERSMVFNLVVDPLGFEFLRMLRIS